MAFGHPRKLLRLRTGLLTPLALAVLVGCSSAPKAPEKKFDTSHEYKPTVSNESQRRAEEAAITKDPDYQAVQSLYQKGRYEDAITKATALEKKLRSPLALAYVRNLKGLSYLATRRPLPAIVQFQRALDYQPPELIKPYVQYNLAAALTDADQVDDALETLKEIDPAALNTETRAKFFTVRAKNLLAKQAWVESARSTLEASRYAGAAAGTKASYVELLDRAVSQISKQDDLLRTLAGLEDSPLADRVKQKIAPGLNLEAPPVTTVGEARSIGVLLPLSGRFSDFGSRVLNAITLALKLFDPNGVEFKLEVEDTGDSAEQTIRALNRLANERKVAVTIGPLLSKGIEQVTARAETLGMPLVTLSQQHGVKGEYVISAGLTPELQAREVAKVAIEKLGLKNFAIVHPKDKFGEQYSQSFWDAVQSLGGKIVGVESYTPGETDFRAVVDKLVGTYYKDARAREIAEMEKKREEQKVTKKTRKTAELYDLSPIIDFEAVFIPDEPKVIGQILPTFAYRDIDKVRFLGIATWDTPELVRRAQNFAEGSVFVDGLFQDSDWVPAQKFIARFQRDTGMPPSTIEAMAYDAALAVETALRDLAPGSISRSDVRDRLKGISDLQGATGRISYRDGELARSLTLLTVRGGKIIELK
jgi:ABC-type branched-subunit amino acid transport system substrate-binding protein/predicted negative regulator of RcsB-dependent stress response